MQFKTSSSCHLLNTSMRACTLNLCTLPCLVFIRISGKDIRVLNFKPYTEDENTRLFIYNFWSLNYSVKLQDTCKHVHAFRSHISGGNSGHLGTRTSRPRTTRPVSPDYSDRVTGPLGPCLLNLDRAHETRQLGLLL